MLLEVVNPLLEMTNERVSRARVRGGRCPEVKLSNVWLSNTLFSSPYSFEVWPIPVYSAKLYLSGPCCSVLRILGKYPKSADHSADTSRSSKRLNGDST